MVTLTRSLNPPPGEQRHRGHAHFWERALSRDRFIKTAALTAGAVAGAELWLPSVARAAGTPNPTTAAMARLGAAAPKPIPGGFNPGIPGGPSLLHVNLPDTPLNDQITITDFAGQMGVAHIQGTGTDGSGNPLTFDADMRFMRGVYIGTDGLRHVATFGFV
jgi:hypothetical protein